MTGREPLMGYRTGQRNVVRMRNGLHLGLCFAAAMLFLCAPTTAGEGVRAGLSLCAYAVIPALFPFLVVSPILTFALQQLLARLFRRHSDTRTAALWSAFAVGMTAGFPIGALSLVSQYEAGTVTKADTEQFLAVCTGASPAFLIGYFGQTLWQNAMLGLGIWAVQCLVCMGGFLCLLHKIKNVGNAVPLNAAMREPTLSWCLREAVPRMLGICGAVVFFSVLRAFLSRGLENGTAAVLGGLAEMTGGLRECAALYGCGSFSRASALTVSAAMIGFGGGCVGMQTADAAGHAGISMRYYWLHRAVIGVIFACLAGGFVLAEAHI